MSADTTAPTSATVVRVRCEVDSSETPHLGFFVGHESWYWPTPGYPRLRARLTVGLYYEGAGCEFEFSFRWREGMDFASLELHDDGWRALTDPRFVGMFATMATMTAPVEPERVVAMLAALGFADLTSREGPS